jgi:hypothetical protein
LGRSVDLDGIGDATVKGFVGVDDEVDVMFPVQP